MLIKDSTCVTFTALFGVCINAGKRTTLPDCGQELCIRGYEICKGERCRSCADFVDTEYGCQNIDTQRECSSFCIDETERKLNVTIQQLLEQVDNTLSPSIQSQRCSSSYSSDAVAAISVTLIVVSMGIGGALTYVVLRRNLRKSNSAFTSEVSLEIVDDNRETEMLRDPRLSQIPPSDKAHELMNQETGT